MLSNFVLETIYQYWMISHFITATIATNPCYALY